MSKRNWPLCSDSCRWVLLGLCTLIATKRLLVVLRMALARVAAARGTAIMVFLRHDWPRFTDRLPINKICIFNPQVAPLN